MGLLLDLLLGSSSGGGNLKIGDWVEILVTGQEGEIIDIHGSDYYVEIDETGGDVDCFKAHELKKIHGSL